MKLFTYIKAGDKCKVKPVTKDVLCWTNYSKESLLQILLHIDWSLFYLLNEVNDQVKFVHEVLQKSTELLVYTKTVQDKERNLWMTTI